MKSFCEFCDILCADLQGKCLDILQKTKLQNLRFLACKFSLIKFRDFSNLIRKFLANLACKFALIKFGDFANLMCKFMLVKFRNFANLINKFLSNLEYKFILIKFGILSNLAYKFTLIKFGDFSNLVSKFFANFRIFTENFSHFWAEISKIFFGFENSRFFSQKLKVVTIY
ncbi:MAG: hypothetical protein K5978_03330 [Campylobacter sp.]|nr:hypothetical protein [Campylobacter sp.]